MRVFPRARVSLWAERGECATEHDRGSLTLLGRSHWQLVEPGLSQVSARYEMGFSHNWAGAAQHRTRLLPAIRRQEPRPARRIVHGLHFGLLQPA